MSKSRFVFEISGEIFTQRAFNIKNQEEEEVILYLNEINYKLCREIEEDIKKKIAPSLVSVELSFREGSILTFGWAIIETVGTIADALSFGEYCSRLINHIISMHLSRAVPNSRTSVHVNALPGSIVIDRNPSISSRLLTPKVLLLITSLNVVLFLGGTIFNSITIPSTLEKYAEAQEKLGEAKSNLQSSEGLLKNAQVDYLIHTKEIELSKSDLERRKDSILSIIDVENKKIVVQVNLLEKRRDSLEKIIKLQQKHYLILKSKMDKLNQQDFKINFIDVLSFSHWTILVLLGFTILSAIISVVTIIKRH